MDLLSPSPCAALEEVFRRPPERMAEEDRFPPVRMLDERFPLEKCVSERRECWLMLCSASSPALLDDALLIKKSESCASEERASDWSAPVLLR